MELSYTAISVNGVAIRLLAERWAYTNACLDDVLGTIERPDLVLRGRSDAQVAVRRMSGKRYLMVTYRELTTKEGFVISAHVEPHLAERAVVWRARGF